MPRVSTPLPGRIDQIVAGFIRGGNWNNGANSGAFTLNLNNAPGNSNTNIGFRCAQYSSCVLRDQNRDPLRSRQLSEEYRYAPFRFPLTTETGKYQTLILVSYRPVVAVQGGVSGSIAYYSMFFQAFTFENLLLAYHRAKKGKQSRHEVAHFGWNLERCLTELRDELYSGRYRHGSYRTFTIADSKRRDIKAAPFRDRVMHQALTAALEPIFERRFIFDSYACRQHKGTHVAIERFERFMRSVEYALTMDISKYFASIDHGILMRLIAARVSDDRLVALCRLVIDSSEDMPGKGIPIGNLTSQLFANIYLDVLDQHVKHGLRFRRYIRYMDDFVFFDDDKDRLHDLKEEISDFLLSRLELTVHPHKAQVLPVRSGVNWLGMRLYPRHRLLRGSTVRRFARRLRRTCRGGGYAQKNKSFLGGLGRNRPIPTACVAPWPSGSMTDGLSIKKYYEKILKLPAVSQLHAACNPGPGSWYRERARYG